MSWQALGLAYALTSLQGVSAPFAPMWRTLAFDHIARPARANERVQANAAGQVVLKRIFGRDLEHCPNCGGDLMTIAAALEQPVVKGNSRRFSVCRFAGFRVVSKVAS